jgi:hypothetical protein
MAVGNGKRAQAGFAGEGYEPARHDETCEGTAGVWLGDGTAFINAGLSLDGQRHFHSRHLSSHVPKTAPFDVALRCDPDGDVPQVQFNEDGVWHDFAPDHQEGEGGGRRRTALKAGPWFPYLHLCEGSNGEQDTKDSTKASTKDSTCEGSNGEQDAGTVAVCPAAAGEERRPQSSCTAQSAGDAHSQLGSCSSSSGSSSGSGGGGGGGMYPGNVDIQVAFQRRKGDPLGCVVTVKVEVGATVIDIQPTGLLATCALPRLKKGDIVVAVNGQSTLGMYQLKHFLDACDAVCDAGSILDDKRKQPAWIYLSIIRPHASLK